MNIQTVYFTLCFLNLFTQSSKVNRFLNGFYTSLVFPIGFSVTVLFWGVYFVHRDLMYPQILEKFIPRYQNHLVHTLPLIGAILDSFLIRHKYKESFVKGVGATVLFLLSYLIWICFIAWYADFWVYPVLSVLSPVNRGIFIAFCGILGCFLYKFGEGVNKFFWSGQKSAKTN